MHYGYKLHTIMNTTRDLIRHIETTTANAHDSQVGLSGSGISGCKMEGIKGGEILYSDQKCLSHRVGEGNNTTKSESEKYAGCILL